MKKKRLQILFTFILLIIIPLFAIVLISYLTTRSGCQSLFSREFIKSVFSRNHRLPEFKQQVSSPPLSKKQVKLLEGARARIGDVYDSSYYKSGYPPKGKSACVDIVCFAFKNIGVDLQVKVNHDIGEHRSLYPEARDYPMNHRWAPNLFVWFNRHSKSLTLETDPAHVGEWKAGDVIFWNMIEADGAADHCGIISDRTNPFGVPLVIHQAGEKCEEEDALNAWRIVGHFRF